MYDTQEPGYFAWFMKLPEEERKKIQQQRQKEFDQEMERKQQEREARIKERERQAAIQQRRYALLHDNARQFLKEGFLIQDPDGFVTSQELYRVYREWCIRQKLPLKPPREFWLHVKEEAPHYAMHHSSSLRSADGKRCRGFQGVRLKQEEDRESGNG